MIEQPEVPDWAIEEPDQGADDNGGAGSEAPDWARASSPEQAAEDAPDWARSAPDEKWSQAGSAAAGAAKGALPTIGGLAAGLHAGAAIAGPATLVAAPLGPLAPVVGGAAGILGGLAVGIGVGSGIDLAQDKFIALMGWDKPLEKAREANPNIFDIAGMATSAALLRPSGTMIQRGAGAAIGAAAEGGMQAIHGEFDPKKILMAGGLGAALPNANRAGSKIIASGDQIGERIGGVLYRGEGGRYRGGNKNPDLKEIPAEDGPPAPEQAPQLDEITVANDVTTTSAGVAMENHPTPVIEGAGNPEGAPMAARESARPSDPERNYQKDQAQTQPDTVESKIIDTEPLKGDIKAALEDVRGASEAPVQQHGTGTDVLPSREAAPTTPVSEAQAAPEALTPAELKMLAENRKILADAGWDRAIARLDALHPREQLDALQNGPGAIEVKRLAAATEGKVVRPTGEVRKEAPRQKVSTGVFASSKADAARKEAAVAHVRGIYDEFGPGSDQGKTVDPLNPDHIKLARDYTKRVWDETLKRNNGRDPLVRSPDQYVPLKKGDNDDAYQWLKAVKASAKGQNHKNFATLHSVKGMGKVDAETGRVEGDIRNKPTVEEHGAEIQIADEQGGAASRETFEPMEPWKDRTGKPAADQSFVTQSNELREWVNDLSLRDYETLQENYKETFSAAVRDADNPSEVMQDMMQTLAAAGRRRVIPGARPKGEVTTEVELPPKAVDAPTLPQKTQEAIDKGRSLKGTDEFKRLAAMYEKDAPKGPALSKAEQLEAIKAKTEGATKAGQTRDLDAPIDGTSQKAVLDKIKAFVGDEEGGLFLNRMFNSPTNPASPSAAPAVTNYADTLSLKFRDRLAAEKNTKVEIMANLAKAADAKLTAREHRQIALAEQDNKVGALPQKLKDFYAEHVEPVRSRAMQVMRDFKDLNDTEKLGYNLPNLNAVTTKAYQPRYQVDKQHFNRKDTDAFDPFTGRGVGDWSPNLEDRTFFALENGPQRMVVEVTGDKDSGFGLNIHRAKGNVQVLKNIPASFEGKLGDVLDLNVKGTKGKWTMDQASTKEIEGATGTKYYENATWAWSRMLDDMTKAYENAKLTVDIKNDPRFEKLTTTSDNERVANGWSKVQTHLPDFATKNGRPVYMPDNLRWVFDDYHKPGFGGITSEGIEKLRDFNIALLKVFNTNAPLVHVLNELDLFVVDRGFKWINPKAYYDLAVAAPKAFKSVNSQDALQAEMRKAGVNPMLASVGMRSMYETAAKNFGMEIIKDHSKWDPVAKLYGVSTKEVGQKLYDASSDVTWRLSDYLTTMRYLEEKASGKSPEEAAKRVNKFMSDYHVGTTVMGSRALQQILTEPAVTAFGRYKAGVFRSLAGMTRNLLAPSATKEERLEALGQWLVMGALGYMVYPAADALVQKLSGNEGGELRRRGVSSITDAAVKIATGDKDPVALAQRAWTPAPVVSAAMDLKANKDFTGKAIYPQGEWPGVIPDGIAGVAEYAAKTVVPPYGTMSQHYARPEGTPGGALGALAADQFGVGLPSDASNKRAGRIERVNAQAEKARHKRPSGVIPDLMNRLTD